MKKNRGQKSRDTAPLRSCMSIFIELDTVNYLTGGWIFIQLYSVPTYKKFQFYRWKAIVYIQFTRRYLWAHFGLHYIFFVANFFFFLFCKSFFDSLFCLLSVFLWVFFCLVLVEREKNDKIYGSLFRYPMFALRTFNKNTI